MLARISPWGLAAFMLAVASLLAASLVGVRSVTSALAGCGVAVAGLGALLAWKRRISIAEISILLGGGLSALVLCLALFSPGILNDYWLLTVAIPDTDPNPLFLIAHDNSRDPGKPMPPDGWVDADKEALRQDDLYIRLEPAIADKLPERGATTYLLINFRLSQIRPERDVVFLGLRKGEHPPVLKDDQGKAYAYFGHRPRRPFLTAFDISLNVDHLLIFELPPVGVESLYLEVPAAAWGRAGICRFHISGINREPNTDMVKAVADTKKMLRTPPAQPPDPAEGRTVFAKNCQECHMLFGFGNKVGPDLTDRGLTPDGRQKRTDLDFLVTNIVDPSAEIAKGFEPSIIVTSAGLVIHGLIKEQTAETVTIVSPSKTTVVLRADIEETRPTKISIMPNELLKPLSEHEIRSLFAYISGPGQVPLLASPKNIAAFFSGTNLNYWHCVPPKPWKAELGELSAPQADGKPSRCISEFLLTGDFRFTCQFHPGTTGGGAIHLLGEGKDDAAGPSIAFAPGKPLALARSDGLRAGPADETNVVQPEIWNKLEITLTGKRLQTRLNDKSGPTLEDPQIPARSVIGLEGAKEESTRFRYLGVVLESRSLDAPKLDAPR